MNGVPQIQLVHENDKMVVLGYNNFAMWAFMNDPRWKATKEAALRNRLTDCQFHQVMLVDLMTRVRQLEKQVEYYTTKFGNPLSDFGA